MATLGDYYHQVGGALGGALQGSGLIGSTTVANTDMNNIYVTSGTQQYYQYYTIPEDSPDFQYGMQMLQQAGAKAVKNTERILDILRAEMNGWCEHVLEV